MNDYGLIDLYAGSPSEGQGFSSTPGPNGSVVNYSAVNPRGNENKLCKKLAEVCADVTLKKADLPLYMMQQNDVAQQMVFDVAMSLIQGWATLADLATGDEGNYDAMIKSKRVMDALNKAGHKK